VDDGKVHEVIVDMGTGAADGGEGVERRKSDRRDAPPAAARE